MEAIKGEKKDDIGAALAEIPHGDLWAALLWFVLADRENLEKIMNLSGEAKTDDQ